METKLARIISILFQPLLIPTYSLLIIFNMNSYVALIIPAEYRQMIVGIILVTTFLFPALFILILYKRKIIKTLHMDQREERIIPLLITSIFYFLAFNLIRRLQIDDLYARLFLGSFISVILALIISLTWKISMHMIGVGGMVGALIGVVQSVQVDMMLWVVGAILISGLTGFARLKVNAHNPLQVYAGFLAGLLIMLLVFWF